MAVGLTAELGSLRHNFRREAVLGHALACRHRQHASYRRLIGPAIRDEGVKDANASSSDGFAAINAVKLGWLLGRHTTDTLASSLPQSSLEDGLLGSSHSSAGALDPDPTSAP